jgi:hypothetical protein
LALPSHRFWPSDKFWARALVQQGKIDEAIEFVESWRQDRPGLDYGSISAIGWMQAPKKRPTSDVRVVPCGRRQTSMPFRQLVQKYPHRDSHETLSDLIARSGQKGKWFNAAKSQSHRDGGTYQRDRATRSSPLTRTQSLSAAAVNCRVTNGENSVRNRRFRY